MAKITYNPKNANSILKYGELLLGRSLRELHPEAVIPSGKGGLASEFGSTNGVKLVNGVLDNIAKDKSPVASAAVDVYHIHPSLAQLGCCVTHGIWYIIEFKI